MRQHTVIHYWFTYRSFPVAFGIVLLALTARVESTSVDLDAPVARRTPQPERVESDVAS